MAKRTNTAVWLEKYNRWQINVQKDGVRRSFTSSTPGRTGQREANRKADEWLDENIDSAGKRVAALYDEWIEALKLTTSKSHWSVYEAFGRNWIKSDCGHQKIDRLSEQHLQNIIDKAFAAGKAKKTLLDLRACLTAFVKYCRRQKSTTLLPEFLSIPKGAKDSVKNVLQPEDIKKLFTCDNTFLRGKERYDLYVNAYRFEVATGLRPGEIIGLEWSDIASAKVMVQRSINEYNEVTDGKNHNARRPIALNAITAAILQAQVAKLRELGVKSKQVFPNETGEHIKQSAYHKRWDRYREYNGIGEVSPYELRHTFVSVAKSLPEGLLKMTVGHSKDMDTYGIYSHELDGDAELAASILQQTFADLLK